jgi:two-component system response regulator VicR
MKRMLTTGDLGKLCGVDHRTINRWVKEGYITAASLPGRGDYRIHAAEAVRFMDEHGIPVPEDMKKEARKA